MGNIIFFAISDAGLRAWIAKVEMKDDAINDLKVNFDEPSIFLTVKNSEEAYYGEISGFPSDDDFLNKIGRKRPINVLIAPVKVKTKVISVLYADNDGKGFHEERIIEIKSLIDKLSIAFEILLLKKKAANSLKT